MNRLKNIASLFSRPKPPVGTTPADVVHRENKWRLLRYRARTSGPAYRTPVLLVPSLINRHYVLDLLPGKSMAEDLVKAGHDVYCVDWGTPGDEDRYLTFDDVCDRYLGRAIRHVARNSRRGNQQDDGQDGVDIGRLGVSVRLLNGDEKQQLKTSGNVVVLSSSGAAAESGIDEGDVILGVNRVRISSVEELQAAIRNSGSTAALLVQSRAQDGTSATRIVTVRLD